MNLKSKVFLVAIATCFAIQLATAESTGILKPTERFGRLSNFEDKIAYVLLNSRAIRNEIKSGVLGNFTRSLFPFPIDSGSVPDSIVLDLQSLDKCHPDSYRFAVELLGLIDSYSRTRRE